MHFPWLALLPILHALALAGLGAHGETMIEDAWQIERGYNGFIDKLKSLGRKIDYA